MKNTLMKVYKLSHCEYWQCNNCDAILKKVKSENVKFKKQGNGNFIMGMIVVPLIEEKDYYCSDCGIEGTINYNQWVPKESR